VRECYRRTARRARRTARPARGGRPTPRRCVRPGIVRTRLGVTTQGSTRWLASAAATAASTYALDAIATACGIAAVASGALDGLGTSVVVGLLGLSYVGWLAGLVPAMRANVALLDRTGLSTHVVSKAAYDLARRRSGSDRKTRIAAACGYVATEAAKEMPYLVGAFGARLRRRRRRGRDRPGRAPAGKPCPSAAVARCRARRPRLAALRPAYPPVLRVGRALPDRHPASRVPYEGAGARGGVGTGFDIGGGVRAERPAGARVCRHRAGLGYPAAVRPVRWPIRRVSRRRPVEPARTS